MFLGDEATNPCMDPKEIVKVYEAVKPRLLDPVPDIWEPVAHVNLSKGLWQQLDSDYERRLIWGDFSLDVLKKGIIGFFYHNEVREGRRIIIYTGEGGYHYFLMYRKTAEMINRLYETSYTNRAVSPANRKRKRNPKRVRRYSERRGSHRQFKKLLHETKWYFENETCGV